MRYKIFLILFIISLMASTILAIQDSGNDQFCDPGEGCSIIKNSKYSSTLGIKNSYFGVLIFLLLSILTVAQIKYPRATRGQIINVGVFLGSIIAIYFIYLQKFVIKAYCKYCMTIDISMLTALLILIISWRQKKWPLG